VSNGGAAGRLAVNPAVDWASIVAEPVGRGFEVLNETPLVGYVDHILSPVECEYVVDKARGRMRRARVSLDTAGTVIPGRSGDNCWLRYEDDPTIAAIGERVASYVGIPLAHAESLQVIRYGPEQEYRPHYDAYDVSTPKGLRCCRDGGQRLITALVYLNVVEAGGETTFPKLGLEITPRPGRLVVFHNVGTGIERPHPDSLHAGAPVRHGEKWACNLWFHAEPMRAVMPVQTPVTAKPQAMGAAPAVPGPIIKVNRAARLFEAAVRRLAPGVSAAASNACFTFWDTYGGGGPDLTGLPDGTRVLALLPRSQTNPLADKRQWARRIASAGLSALAPATFESVEDALRYGDPNVRLWFVKNRVGTGGKGMSCVRPEDLAQTRLPPDYIVQAGVTDIRLVEGRKFTTRIYALIWNRGLYLYNDGFLVIHGVPYRPDSTDYAVQIDHAGYHADDGPVRMQPLSEIAGHEQWFAEFIALMTRLRPVLRDVVEASDENRYAVLGIDLLIHTDGSAKVIEVNTMPNFVHSRRVNETVNIPFFTALMNLMLSGSNSSFIDIPTTVPAS
jgi:prolyl 4-hydroxylase